MHSSDVTQDGLEGLQLLLKKLLLILLTTGQIFFVLIESFF